MNWPSPRRRRKARQPDPLQRITSAIDDLGDETDAIVWVWPGYRVTTSVPDHTHLLDAEFQRGEWTPKDAA
jgi:hypothetical protein